MLLKKSKYYGSDILDRKSNPSTPTLSNDDDAPQGDDYAADEPSDPYQGDEESDAEESQKDTPPRRRSAADGKRKAPAGSSPISKKRARGRNGRLSQKDRVKSKEFVEDSDAEPVEKGKGKEKDLGPQMDSDVQMEDAQNMMEEEEESTGEGNTLFYAQFAETLAMSRAEQSHGEIEQHGEGSGQTGGDDAVEIEGNGEVETEKESAENLVEFLNTVLANAALLQAENPPIDNEVPAVATIEDKVAGEDAASDVEMEGETPAIPIVHTLSIIQDNIQIGPVVAALAGVAGVDPDAESDSQELVDTRRREARRKEREEQVERRRQRKEKELKANDEDSDEDSEKTESDTVTESSVWEESGEEDEDEEDEDED